jgi:hypothetical protein
MDMALVGSGVIGPGQAEHFSVVLQAGVTYRVYVAPSDSSVDFDLYIHDENGNLIAYDDTTYPDAMCDITPRWTGPFMLSVKAARGLASYTISVQD